MTARFAALAAVALLAGARAADACAAVAAATATTAVPLSGVAAQDWQAIQDFANARPVFSGTETRREKLETYDAWVWALHRRLRAFYGAYTHDPLRWNAVLMMLRAEPPLFSLRYGPDVEETGIEGVVIDTAAQSAFERKLDDYVDALDAADDVPPDVRQAVDTLQIVKAVKAAGARPPGDLKCLRRRLDAFAREYPGSDVLERVVSGYMDAFSAGRTAAEVIAEWATFAGSPSPTVAALAAGEVRDAAHPVAAVPVVYTASGQEWLTDWAAARMRAAKEGKRLLLEFTGSDWCHFCHELEREVFATAAFAAFASDYVLVRLDYPRKTKLPLAERIQNATLKRTYDISGYPTVILTDASGGELSRLKGYAPGTGPSAFLSRLTGGMQDPRGTGAHLQCAGAWPDIAAREVSDSMWPRSG